MSDKNVKGCTGITISIIIAFLIVLYLVSFIFGPDLASWIRRLMN